ncbi:MAG: alpha/beta fold hydrolase [Xenococcaceae cyanobacterium MO_207.B15]|nr:alpha/beta fold hydrolase [Xenococcaceae cyanobacterium MO_207.B15]
MIEECQIEVGKLQWFYRQTATESEKPPVLLLHGLPTHGYTWRGVMTSLEASGYSAIAPDWIGSGFSAKPDKREFAYTPQAFIAALENLITTLELEKFYLVVQGFLGSVGIQYALAHPQQVERLIILNTPLTPEMKLPWKMKQWGIPFVGDMLTQDPLQVDRTLEGGSGFVIEDKDLNIHRKPFLTSSSAGRALGATIKSLDLNKTTTEISEGLKTWEQPTLIIWGVEDPWLAIADAEIVAKSNSKIELVKLPEAKHYPQEHWSEEIGKEITQFFRRSVF